MITLEQLKEMELPVKVCSLRHTVSILFIGNRSVFVRNDLDSSEKSIPILDILAFYELAPKVKIVEVDSELHVRKDGCVFKCSLTKKDVIDTIHIKRRYHIDEESGEVLKVEVL